MTELLAEIDRLKAELSQLRPLTQSELNRLRNEFIIESSYNSNAIEGNTITLRETALILNDGITIAEKPIREHLDIIGFRDAFNFLFELVANNEPLSERTIKDIHALVLMSNAEHKGKYRAIPVKILGAENEPTPPHFIAEEMAELISTYHQLKSHPLIAIAWLHLSFESIHPFIDGNGRTGRLLLNFELLKRGYLPVDIKFKDRAKYYQCFDDFHKTGKPTALCDLIAGYELAELERYIQILK
ncbi:Fic family protein [Rodentibacter haemolyticus]|uniref:Fic family protein n=1 Tax=Rodentibacter haemolyticus TaxID=2778911 RepID=A0ABX6UXH1_9PAST|nr:Fic family protein [Rodentibacter haemolyticus]